MILYVSGGGSLNQTLVFKTKQCVVHSEPESLFRITVLKTTILKNIIAMTVYITTSKCNFLMIWA